MYFLVQNIVSLLLELNGTKSGLSSSWSFNHLPFPASLMTLIGVNNSSQTTARILNNSYKGVKHPVQ